MTLLITLIIIAGLYAGFTLMSIAQREITHAWHMHQDRALLRDLRKNRPWS